MGPCLLSELLLLGSRSSSSSRSRRRRRRSLKGQDLWAGPLCVWTSGAWCFELLLQVERRLEMGRRAGDCAPLPRFCPAL